MVAVSLDATAPAWSTPSPTLPRPVLCVGTPITLHGYERPLVHRELAWLHGALTARLGRGHDQPSERSLMVQDWSILPWPSPSGCAVAWWDEADGAAVARSRAPARIGRVPVELELGAPVRVHSPPRYLPGAYPVRLSTRSLVVVASVDRRGDGRRRYHERASTCIESALWTLARKLRVMLDVPPAVHVIADRTRPASVAMRGKPGRVHGWEGQVDLLCSPTARWLLECASRGLGLGARGAYGYGAVHVEDLRWPANAGTP